jgi:hypothetical protein
METVEITEAEWKGKEETEAFGVIKSIQKKRDPIPGMKAILIEEGVFMELKHFKSDLKHVRPAVDLPEIATAALALCLEGEDARNTLLKKIIQERQESAGQMLAQLSQQ